MKFFSIKTSAAYILVATILALFQPRIASAQQGASSSTPSESDKSSPVPSSVLSRSVENLDELALDASDLIAEKPLVGEKDELPEFTRELIQLHWRFADPIDLYVIRPKGVEKPPVVLYLYSYPTDGDQFKDDGYCRRATQGGFAAVGFVSALTGQRYHGRPMKQWFVSELQEALVSSTHDVQMILNYLATRDDLNMDRVGMMGAGSGATIAVLAASVEPRIKVLDLLNPWGDWPDWMAYSARIPDAERPNYIKPQFLERVAPFDPVQRMRDLKSLPVRLEFVADDITVPVSCQKKIEAAAPQSSVQVVKFDSTKALLNASTGGRHFQWIKDQLAPTAAPAKAR